MIKIVALMGIALALSAGCVDENYTGQAAVDTPGDHNEGHAADTTPDAHAAIGPHDEDAGADELACASDLDCPEGMHCNDSVACGEPPRCEPGEWGNTCSAAPPYMACLCNGTIGAVSAGCPGPHHYPMTRLWYDFGGQPCDPNNPNFIEDHPPLDILLTGSGFDAYNDLTVHARLVRGGGDDPRATLLNPIAIEQGAFNFIWPNALQLAQLSQPLELFIDLDEDG
ncbi:MAG: hypothetical protein AAFS10_10420, partial [Myxococcota bacterium]